MKPITPKEFQDTYGNGIPDIVIETVNDLIKSKSTYENRNRFTLGQTEVVDALVAKGVDRATIFKENMLDFEPIYRKMGWCVVWNKGAYYESDSHWDFLIE